MPHQDLDWFFSSLPNSNICVPKTMSQRWQLTGYEFSHVIAAFRLLKTVYEHMRTALLRFGPPVS